MIERLWWERFVEKMCFNSGVKDKNGDRGGVPQATTWTGGTLATIY